MPIPRGEACVRATRIGIPQLIYRQEPLDLAYFYRAVVSRKLASGLVRSREKVTTRTGIRFLALSTDGAAWLDSSRYTGADGQ